MHHDILSVIDRDQAMAFETGLSLSELTLRLNYVRSREGRKNVKDSTIAGRLSELQGLKVLSCVPADVTLTDRTTMQFMPSGEPKWYRVGNSLLEEQP